MAEPFRFHTSLRVRYMETDAQGHVNFAWYFNYFDVALVDYLKAIGYSYRQMMDDGFDMFYVDTHAAYHSPCHFDEPLRVHCRAGNLGNTSARFDFQVFSDSDERLVATGEITIVIFEQETRQKASLPKGLRQAVEAYEGAPEGR